MYKVMGLLTSLIMYTTVAQAGSEYISTGQYNCSNYDAADVNEQMQEIAKTGRDTYPSLMNFGKNSVSVTYGPSGFQSTTNYWGTWKKEEPLEFFVVSSSEPQSPLNWNLMVVIGKNKPVTYRRTKNGFRGFAYNCVPMN